MSSNDARSDTAARISRGSLVDVCDEVGPVERMVVDDVTRGRVTLEDGSVYWAKSPMIRLVDGIRWDHERGCETPAMDRRLEYHIEQVIWGDLPRGTMMSMAQIRALVENATTSQLERARVRLMIAKGGVGGYCIAAIW